MSNIDVTVTGSCVAVIQYSMQRLAVELDALSGCMDLRKLVIKILCLVLEGALILFCLVSFLNSSN